MDNLRFRYLTLENFVGEEKHSGCGRWWFSDEVGFELDPERAEFELAKRRRFQVDWHWEFKRIYKDCVWNIKNKLVKIEKSFWKQSAVRLGSKFVCSFLINVCIFGCIGSSLRCTGFSFCCLLDWKQKRQEKRKPVKRLLQECGHHVIRQNAGVSLRFQETIFFLHYIFPLLKFSCDWYFGKKCKDFI